MTKIGLIRHFPNVANAELENMIRIKESLSLLGYDSKEIEVPTLETFEEFINVSRDLDFVIELHFEFPKIFNGDSIAPLWNPVDYILNWGFKKNMLNQLSHTYVVKNQSRNWLNYIQKLDKQQTVLESEFNHSLREVEIEKNINSASKLFYVGINWEKIRGKGRHSDLLKILDNMNLINIFGPKVIAGGVKPWEGYNNYCGEIPFNGYEIINIVNKTGIGLLINSNEHVINNIASNRLFEFLASKVPVISEFHPFAYENFKDEFYWFDNRLSLENQVAQIEAHLDFIRNPDNYLEVSERIERSHEKFKSRFELTKQLKQMFDEIELIKLTKFKNIDQTRFKLTCVLIFNSLTQKEFEEWISNNLQFLKSIDYFFVILQSKEEASKLQGAINKHKLSDKLILVPTFEDLVSNHFFKEFSFVIFCKGFEIFHNDIQDNLNLEIHSESVDCVFLCGTRIHSKALLNGGQPEVVHILSDHWWDLPNCTFAFNVNFIRNLKTNEELMALFVFIANVDHKKNLIDVNSRFRYLNHGQFWLLSWVKSYKECIGVKEFSVYTNLRDRFDLFPHLFTDKFLFSYLDRTTLSPIQKLAGTNFENTEISMHIPSLATLFIRNITSFFGYLDPRRQRRKI